MLKKVVLKYLRPVVTDLCMYTNVEELKKSLTRVKTTKNPNFKIFAVYRLSGKDCDRHN